MAHSPDAADWLTFPAQLLRTLTASAVYHDGVGELTALRARLAYYPRDVWLLLLAAGWRRIGQEEHLMPRAGYVDDELGSALIGARPPEVVFTASGTEANNAVLFHLAHEAGRSGHLVISAIEHPSIREAAARLAQELRDAGGNADDTFAGIYGDGDGKRVTVFGVTGWRLPMRVHIAAKAPASTMTKTGLIEFTHETGICQPNRSRSRRLSLKISTTVNCCW